MVENGTEFPLNFNTDAMEFEDIELFGAEEEPDTPLALVPTISITETEDTPFKRASTPEATPAYFTQDSLITAMEERGRPLSVSEIRNSKYRPPPRSQTMGEPLSRYKKKVEHSHISIKVSPQLNKKRMSFLYRPQLSDGQAKSRSQSLISNSSFQSALYDNFLTPFARVLLHMKHMKDSLNTLESNFCVNKDVNNNNEDNRNTISNLMLINASLQDLDECMEIVESLENGKSMGESAGDKFRQILQMELQHMSPSPANARVAEWVVSEFVEQDNDMNSFVSNSCEIDSLFQMCPLDKPRKMSTLANSISAPLLDTLNSKRRISIPKQISNKSDIRTNTELMTYLHDNIANWDMDIFKVNTLSAGFPLAATSYVVLQSHDLFKKCKIDESTFLNYISEIESAYKDNPYHNSVHAADVVFNANYLLSCETFKSALQDWMILGLIIAAAIHDCDHPGRNNKFLINTKNDLATTYNDESVLENHHCATGFRLLKDTKRNIFANFSTKAYTMTRRLIIDLVLATDMNKHLGIIGKLKTTIESFNIKESEELELSSSNFSDILHALLHCADLANPAKPREIAIQWSRKIEEESYQQGDEERKIGLEISHMCDRHNPIFEKNQYTFLMYIALPLWESWSELVYPHATIMLDHLTENKDYWESVQPLSPEAENECKQIDD